MKDLILLLPEIYLTVTCLGILLGEIGYHGERFRLVKATAFVGLLGALVQVLLTYPYAPASALAQTMAVDGLALFFKTLCLLIGLQALLIVTFTKEIRENQKAEYCAFIVGATLAMCLVASASNLLIVFLALQFLQVLFYFLSGFGKHSAGAVEAAAKQWVFSAVGAFFFLFGILFLMAWTNTLSLQEIRQALVAAPFTHTAGWIVFILVFLALSFQMGVFPMHFWIPDALEGAPTPVSAFLSIGTLTAALAFGIRFFLAVFAQPSLEWGQWQVLGNVAWPRFVAVVAAISLLVGPLLAFRQQGAKRLCACLMISEAGFLLLGLLVLDQAGIVAILYNILADLFCVMGLFGVLAFFHDEFGSDRLADLRGVLKNAFPETLVLLLLLACLVGIPPLPGFIGKFALISGAVQKGWVALALIGGLSMALAITVFARFSYSLAGEFAFSGQSAVSGGRGRRLYFALLFVPLALLVLFTDSIFYWAEQSLKLILW